MTFIDNITEHEDPLCKSLGHNYHARYVGSKLYEKCETCGKVKKIADLRFDKKILKSPSGSRTDKP